MYNKIIKWSIYLLVFLVPIFFLPFSFEIFEFNKQYLLFFLTSLAFFSWIAKMVLVDKELRFKRTPLDIAVLVFLFVAILSAIFSVDKNSSLFGFYGRFSDGLIGFISLVVLYFLITNNVSADKEQITKNIEQKTKNKTAPYSILSVPCLTRVFLWSTFFVVLISYLSIFGVWAKVNNLLAGKFSFPPTMLQSIFNPAAGSLEGLAVFLAVILIFLIGRILTSEKEGKKGKNSFNYSLLILILILLLIIDSTPAWMVILGSLLLFLVFALWKRIFKEDVNKLLLPISLVIIAAVFLFVNLAGLQTLLLKFQLPREQILSQGQSWLVGFKGATENIKSGFWGSGFGTWHYDFAKFKPVDFNQSLLWQIRFDRAGSHIAEILGNMGFLGLISYFFLIGFFLLISYLFLQQNKSGLPLFIAFLGLLVSQFVYYQNTILAFTFWLVLGLSAVSWQKPIKEKVISFKDFPELSLVFSAILIVLGLAVLGMYFFAGKFYLADIYYKNAAGEKRTENLEKAVSLNPYQSQYKIVISRDYLSKVISENQKPENQRDQTLLANAVHRAITYSKGGQIGAINIKGAADLSPNWVAVFETLGMIYRDIQGIATGALEWAIKSFEKAITLEPTNPVLHTELGKLYLVSGEKEKAIAEFNKAKELKLDYADASIQIALLYESENNLNEAVRELEGLAAMYPFNVEVIFQLGRLYFNNNRVDDAILQFQAITTSMPNHSNAHYSLGVAYQKKGEISKAKAEFEKVLELNPDNADVKAKLKELQ